MGRESEKKRAKKKKKKKSTSQSVTYHVQGIFQRRGRGHKCSEIYSSNNIDPAACHSFSIFYCKIYCLYELSIWKLLTMDKDHKRIMWRARGFEGKVQNDKNIVRAESIHWQQLSLYQAWFEVVPTWEGISEHFPFLMIMTCFCEDHVRRLGDLFLSHMHAHTMTTQTSVVRSYRLNSGQSCGETLRLRPCLSKKNKIKNNNESVSEVTRERERPKKN